MVVGGLLCPRFVGAQASCGIINPGTVDPIQAPIASTTIDMQATAPGNFNFEATPTADSNTVPLVPYTTPPTPEPPTLIVLGGDPSAPSNLQPRILPDGSPYVCHNYVYEQLTGQPSTHELDPDDVTNACSDLNFTPVTYLPHVDQLPDSFPPGTVLQFQNHTGIVGGDGKTVFNYTQPAPHAGIPYGSINQNTAQQIWNKRPYQNSPVKVWTPPE